MTFMENEARQNGIQTWRIHLSETYCVRFTGTISRWQRLCLWLAGILVTEAK